MAAYAWILAGFCMLRPGLLFICLLYPRFVSHFFMLVYISIIPTIFLAPILTIFFTGVQQGRKYLYAARKYRSTTPMAPLKHL